MLLDLLFLLLPLVRSKLPRPLSPLLFLLVLYLLVFARKKARDTSPMLIPGTPVHETLPRPRIGLSLLVPSVTQPYSPFSVSWRSLVRGVLVCLSVSLPRRRMGSLASEILPVVYSLGSCYGTWECSQAWQLRTPPRENTRCNGPRARSDGIDKIASSAAETRFIEERFIVYIDRYLNRDQILNLNNYTVYIIKRMMPADNEIRRPENLCNVL